MAACTWNPSDKHTSLTLSNGNLTATTASSATTQGVRATMGKIIGVAGKFYFEITFGTLGPGNAGVGPAVGVATSAAVLSTQAGYYTDNTVTLNRTSGTNFGTYYNNSKVQTTGVLTNNTVVGVAVDVGAATLIVSINGTWYNTPVTIGAGTIYPFLVLNTASDTATANFSTAFTYPVPTGYGAWDPVPIPRPTLPVTSARPRFHLGL
jgi:hypothetical protein